MQKTAQKRSVLNRLREMTNVSGIAAEKFFSPQFEEVMDNLRSVDSNIRSIVAGRQLEGGNSGAIDRSMKDILNSAKSNLNRREFMTAIAELSRFHSKFKEVMTQIGGLHQNVDKVHHQFLFQDLGDEHKKQLQDLPGRWAAANQQPLVKEAIGESIKDFLHNVFDDRGRSLHFYEKRYPKQVNALKNAANKMLTRSQALLSMVLVALKEMASARATRNPDKYIQAAGRIEKGYRAYDVSFKDFYDNNVKQYEKFFKETGPTKEVGEQGLGGQEVTEDRDTVPGMPPVPSLPPGQEPVTVVPTGEDPTTVVPTGDTQPAPPSAPVFDLTNPKIPGPPKVPSGLGLTQPPSSVPSTIPNAPMSPTMMGVAPAANPPKIQTIPYGKGMTPAPKVPPIMAHRKFYETLESLSGEHPRIVANFIQKYAVTIQQNDPQTAIELLQIAKSVRG